MMHTTAKHWFLTTALRYLGTPYIWSGDDPSGFDCSGLVLECLKSAGLVGEEEDLSADSLMHRFATYRVDSPAEGALLFILDHSGRATHVVICLDEHFQIGASGGRSTTADAQSAWRDNAYVKIRPIPPPSARHVFINLFVGEDFNARRSDTERRENSITT